MFFDFRGATHEDALAAVTSEARYVALHLQHDHPIADRARREQGVCDIRRRSRLHAVPRLWHTRKLYMYYLELRHPLWLGVGGTIYREFVDWFGNSYFLEAEIWLRDVEGLERIYAALRKLDPCGFPDPTKGISP